MEKKIKKIKKVQEDSIEASVLKFLDRSMRKTIKRSYWGTGITLAFMKNEFVDQIGQMEKEDIMELLNDPALRDNLLDQIGKNLSNLVKQERTKRIADVKRRIAQQERTRKYHAAEKKRRENWKKTNEKKVKAHKDLRKNVQEKLPKRYQNMLFKLAPSLKNDIKPYYDPYY